MVDEIEVGSSALVKQMDAFFGVSIKIPPCGPVRVEPYELILQRTEQFVYRRQNPSHGEVGSSVIVSLKRSRQHSRTDDFRPLLRKSNAHEVNGFEHDNGAPLIACDALLAGDTPFHSTGPAASEVAIGRAGKAAAPVTTEATGHRWGRRVAISPQRRANVVAAQKPPKAPPYTG